MKVIGVIPARRGSKRLPGKNTAPLGGRPLITHTFEQVSRCPRLDRVVVSTDDPTVARLAREAGLPVVDRPPELAADESLIGDVCRHALLETEARDGIQYDVHILFQPTSPFRTPELITEGIEKLLSTDCDSVMALRPVIEHPSWMRYLDNGLALPFHGDPTKHQRKQDLSQLFFPTGSLYVTYRPTLVDRRAVLGDRIAAIFTTYEEGIDVDTSLDLQLAQLILEGRHA